MPENQTSSTINGIADLLNGVGGFASSVMQGDNTASDYNFKAQESEFNAEEVGINIKQLWNQEIFQEGQRGEHGAQMEGGERAALAAQGLNVNSSASRSITDATASITGRDMFQIRNNAFMKAFGFDAQKLEYQAEGKLDRNKAQSAEDAGLFGGIAKFAGSGLKAAAELGV